MTHSQLAQTAYRDLLQLLQDEPACDIIGNPHKVMRGGKAYWYDMYRFGTAVKNRYLGEDGDETLARIVAHKAQDALASPRADTRARLIRVLRAEGMTTTAREIAAILINFEKSGVFNQGGILVGTHAFQLYEGLLGLRYDGIDNGANAAPNDAISIALPPNAKRFQDLEFIHPSDAKGSTIWRWKHAKNGGLIEFLTPSQQVEDAIRPLPMLGLAAQSRPYLAYLTEKPINASLLYRAGVLVRVPAPARYAIHKLIVAARRKAEQSQKAQKDRSQAAFLIDALAKQRPDDLQAAYLTALALPGATAHIAASLAQMPETATHLAAFASLPKPNAKAPAAECQQFAFNF
jgi:hypothetical protein